MTDLERWSTHDLQPTPCCKELTDLLIGKIRHCQPILHWQQAANPIYVSCIMEPAAAYIIPDHYLYKNIDLLDGGIGYFDFSKNIFNSQLCSQISWLGHNLEHDHTYIHAYIHIILMFGTKIICNLRSSCKKGKTFIDIGRNCWKSNSQLVKLNYLLFQPLGGYCHKFTQQNKRCTLHCGSAYVEILEN